VAGKEKTRGSGKGGKDGRDLKQLNARIPLKLHREIKVYCAKKGISIQDFAKEAFQDKLKKRLDIS
jgi:predicted HicB family RNase H-like nuclease